MDADKKIDGLTQLRLDYEDCSRCGLCKPAGRNRINVVYGGNTVDADVMVIGEGPGFMEDENGQPFWPEAPSGGLVDRFLSSMNSSREDVWIDNMTMCRATEADDPRRDRPPSKDEIAACRPRILRTIALVDPKVILLLGKTALKLAKFWADYEDAETEPIRTGITGIAREADPRRLVVEVPGAILPAVRYPAFATFHPAYLLRLKEQELEKDNSDMEMSWRTWRHVFRYADAQNYTISGNIPPQRGVENP